MSWFEGFRRRKAKEETRLTAEQALERLAALREVLARLEGQSRNDLQVTLQLLPLGSRLALDAVGAVQLEGQNPVEGRYRLEVLPFCIDVVNAAVLSVEKAIREGREDSRTDDDLAAALHNQRLTGATPADPAASLTGDSDRDALSDDAGPSETEPSATAAYGALRLAEPQADPEPLVPVAIAAKSRIDDNVMLAVLHRLVADEPRCRLEVNTRGRPHVLWCVENADADRLLDRLSSELGTGAETTKLRLPLCETVKDSGQGLGRIVGQTGGRREFAICNILVESLQPGAGFEFVDKVKGGAIPRQFIPSVERGVQAQMGQGVLAGYPMVDIRVTLLDGRAHSVDSSDMAFQKAGSAALRDAAEKAGVVLLEPIDRVSVQVAQEHVEKLGTDLSSRRGRILDSEPAANGWAQVEAEIPELEITSLAAELRSMSHGIRSLHRTYLRYQPLPPKLAEDVSSQPPSR